MNKSICVSSIMLLMAVSAQAQFIYKNNKVSIATETEVFEPILMVGDHSYFGTSANASFGMASTPAGIDNNNIGIYGRVGANSSYSLDKNYGVLGLVGMNSNHGRNYGLCGIIDPSGNSYGGAGIYATCYDYYYTYPTNIQGTYAAYFDGNVYVSNNLTASSLFTTMDSRLCDNIVSLSQSNRSGKTTLENLLNMNIVEYNLKGRQFDEVSGDADPEKAEELRRELEFLKKEDKEMTSRRHYGVDASELQKVYPNLVLEGQDGYLSVNYLEMVPLIIRSIQELKQEIDELAEIGENEE